MKTKQQVSKKYVGSVGILILLMTITYYSIFRTCRIENLVEIIKKSDVRCLAVAIFMAFMYIYLEGVNLGIIGKSLGVQIHRIRSFCYACIDIYFCGITPSATGGQPVLAFYMSKDEIPISKSTIMILLYTVMYKMVLLVLSIGLLFVHCDFVMHNNMTMLLYIIGIITNVAIVSVCLLSMYSKTIVEQVGEYFLTLLAKLGIIKGLDQKLLAFHTQVEEYHKSAKFLKENHKVLLKISIITFIQRVALFSIGYWVFRSFGLSNFKFLDIVALQVAIAITVDSLPLPGAVGVSEAMFFLLYRKVYTPDFIMPAMVLTRGISFYFMLLLCGIVTMGYHLFSVKPRKFLKGEKVE